MYEGDPSENCLEAEGLGSKLGEDDVLWHCLLAPDNMPEKENLNSFSRCQI